MLADKRYACYVMLAKRSIIFMIASRICKPRLKSGKEEPLRVSNALSQNTLVRRSMNHFIEISVPVIAIINSYVP